MYHQRPQEHAPATHGFIHRPNSAMTISPSHAYAMRPKGSRSKKRSRVLRLNRMKEMQIRGSAYFPQLEQEQLEPQLPFKIISAGHSKKSGGGDGGENARERFSD